jgi:hypothetical protein
LNVVQVMYLLCLYICKHARPFDASSSNHGMASYQQRGYKVAAPVGSGKKCSSAHDHTHTYYTLLSCAAALYAPGHSFSPSVPNPQEKLSKAEEEVAYVTGHSFCPCSCPDYRRSSPKQKRRL